ncbi:MAG: zf-TFIIB domain-containing protein [Desulfovibrio sp.]|jgi:hypothetical protein|nr:zf-TFIIB domain-containing protein [Desulfovibrio sp.]
MKCPQCNIELMMTERQGIEIDYCSQCRGVWLDRGELDKIIERSAQDSPGYAPPRQQQPVQHYKQPEYHHPKHDNRDYHGDKHYKHHKKKSLLGEIFDFD